ncbi:MAG: ATP-binding protein, partial [Paenibacillus sp.]|nr:ATP-binding protein [Paenibacillus sp.]
MDKLDIRQEEQLKQSFELADHIVMKKYLSELADYEVVPMDKHRQMQELGDTVRLYKLGKIVYDQKEIALDKLTTVYNALAGSKGSLIIVITSDGAHTDFYMGTKAEGNPGTLAACQNTLEKAFKGNFPGSELIKLKNQQAKEVIEGLFQSTYESSLNPVSAVSGVASLRNQDKNQFVQGIEKLLDAMRGEKFSVVYVADPVSHSRLDDIRSGYEDLYTQLSPFAASDLQFSANENTAVTEGLTSGFSETVTESLSKTNATTENNTRTSNQSSNTGRNIITTSFVKLFGGKTSTSRSESHSTGYSSSRTESMTNGTSMMNSTQESTSKAISEGTGRSLQLKMTNKAVESLMERIDDQLNRLKKSEDLGLWNSAAYFIAEDVQTVKIAANTYKSLMRGDNSAVENAVVNTWDNKNKANLIQVTNYVGKLTHPLINLGSKYAGYTQQVTPGTLVNGSELAIQAGLPMKSIAGLPVIEAAEFGRNVTAYQ